MITSSLFLAIGPGQIAIIAVCILLIFGGKKIPELMKGLGTGIKEFKKGVKEDDSKEDSKEDSSKE
jgi:sec-independent protein translocase protein TatA